MRNAGQGYAPEKVLLDVGKDRSHNQPQIGFGFRIQREYEPALKCGGGCVNRVRREIEQP